MICAKCGKDFSTVIDSRPSTVVEYGRRRRHKCLSCGEKWTTIEAPVSDKELADFLRRRKYDKSVLDEAIVRLDEIKKLLSATPKYPRKMQEKPPAEKKQAKPVPEKKDKVKDFAAELAAMDE